MTFNLNHNYQIQNHQYHKQKRINKILDVFVCISVRLIFIVQSVISIYVMVSLISFIYLVLALCVVFIALDALFVTFYRSGKEYTWYNIKRNTFSLLRNFIRFKIILRYSISSVLYTVIVLSLIWNVTIIKEDHFENKCHINTNNSNIAYKLHQYWFFVNYNIK